MDLQAFIRLLEKSGELTRIREKVSTRLEITEITDRISKSEGGGKALLFENNGTGFPLLINSLGSASRIKLAFRGYLPEELALEVTRLISSLTGAGSGLIAKVGKLPLLGKVSGWLPVKKNGRGRCQEIIEMEPDLQKLPVLTCWPHDGGPFITLPLVHTIDPVTGSPNLGMYRMQVFDTRTTGMHWHLHKTGARHYREHERLKRKMPVAVALGGDPVYTYCATAPLPDGIDEYLLAGFIRKEPVRLVRCITQDLWVPQDCDFVIEGYVDPEEPLRQEGPFGDHTGFYSLEDAYPVFHVTAITHREEAVYPATVVGIPPQEDAWIEWATERLFEPLIRLSLVPELTGFHMPTAGVAHNLVLASIETAFPGHGRKALHALWGAGQMMFTKLAIIVGNEPRLTDYEALARHVSARVDPARHVERATGPLDCLDHSSAEPVYGGKLGLDATGPVLETNAVQEQYPDLNSLASFRSVHPEIKDINLDWIRKGIAVGLVSLSKGRPGIIRELMDDIRQEEFFSPIRFWFFFDREVNLKRTHDLVWLVGNHVDASNDIVISAPGQTSKNGILFVDATTKSREMDGFRRPWPNPVVMDDTTISLVDRKWDSYGLGPMIPSPSLEYRPLVREGGARVIE